MDAIRVAVEGKLIVKVSPVEKYVVPLDGNVNCMVIIEVAPTVVGLGVIEKELNVV